MKNRIIPVFAVVFCAFAGRAYASDGPGHELSLDECMTMALENNMSVRNAELDVFAARAQKQEAFAEYFPKVSVNAFAFYAFDPLLELGVTDILGESDFSRNLQDVLSALGSAWGFDPVYSTMKHGVTATVSAMQPLFAGGRIVNGNKLASLGVEAAGLQQSMTRRRTSEEIEKSYWQVVALEEKKKTLDYLQTLVDTLYRDVSSACAAGLASRNDLLQVSLKQNELKSGKIQLKNGIRLAKMNLFNSIGLEYNPYSTVPNDSIPYIDDIVLTDRLDSLSPPQAYYRPEEEVAAGLEESRLLEISVQSKRLEKKMAMGEALPQIGIGASYGYNHMVTDGRMNGAVFAMVQIPLSDWGKTSRKMQRYDSQLEKARNEQEYLDAQLVLQVRKLWLDIEASWEQMLVARESVAVAESSVSELSAYYHAGMSPLSELLQSQTQLQQASEEFIERSIDYKIALQAYLNRCR